MALTLTRSCFSMGSRASLIRPGMCRAPALAQPFAGVAAGLLAAGLLAFFPAPALAYVGPGAGFAFFTSFFVFFLTFLIAFFTLLVWPIRYVVQLLRHRHGGGPADVRRVVIVGLDGMEPQLAERFIKEGKLPHLARLAERGSYRRLRTTVPAISPVAWSSFSTGTNPARHNIFDFLTRDRRTYLPVLSSAEVGVSPRALKLGRYAIPLGKPRYRLMRKSRAFWSILGDRGIFSAIIRVPITFPPEKFNGVMLSAMGVPDLRGTQGTFSFYTSRDGEAGEMRSAEHTGGVRIPVKVDGQVVRSHLVGPTNTLLRNPTDMHLPFTVKLAPEKGEAELRVGRERVVLRRRVFSPWVRLSFAAAPGVKVYGIALFYLKEISPHFELYVSPINIDPQKPALPISHPYFYSAYLAKLLGSYSTLGLAEDTWALNEGVIDEEAFLAQAYLIDGEREKMLMNELDKVRRGAVVCVFDAVDRIQHMFLRFLDEKHPAAQGPEAARHRGAIEDLYRYCDALVGRVAERLGPRDVLLVMSDHGFKQFRRGVNLNSWLYLHGYLALKEGHAESGEWFAHVDWSRTRAYAMGLGGMYLNLQGREAQGIVEPGPPAEALLAELRERLTGLRDEEKGEVAIEEMISAREAYRGPYVANAPDLIVGYAEGYRVSWDAATGKVNQVVFEDNRKAWGADHCINPRRVPGVLFTSRAIASADPNIMDIAPSVLELFGVPAPAYMDGRSIWERAGALEKEKEVAGVTG